MEAYTHDSKTIGINFPKRMGRNGSYENFGTSKNKTLYFTIADVFTDGATGEVVIKLHGPEDIVQKIKNGTFVMNGTFFYKDGHPEIEKLFDDLDQLEFGTRDLSKVDILRLLAKGRITLL